MEEVEETELKEKKAGARHSLSGIVSQSAFQKRAGHTAGGQLPAVPHVILQSAFRDFEHPFQ
jgi:hypothetical protein